MCIIVLPPRMMSGPRNMVVDWTEGRREPELVTESMDSLTMTLEIQCKIFFSMLSSPCVIFRTLCYGLNCTLLKTIRRRKWQPTPVPLPGKSHGWRSLVGYSPWGRDQLDMTERLHLHFSLSCIGEGHGNSLQCSCLENPMDMGAWWAAIYGVEQSQT